MYESKLELNNLSTIISAINYWKSTSGNTDREIILRMSDYQLRIILNAVEQRRDSLYSVREADTATKERRLDPDL